MDEEVELVFGIIDSNDPVQVLFGEELEEFHVEDRRRRYQQQGIVPTIPKVLLPQPRATLVEQDQQALHMFHNLLVFQCMMNVMEGNDDDDEARKRKPKVVRNRMEAWNFILSWDDTLFQRQFRISKEDFFILCEKCKSVYPGISTSGITNYRTAILQGTRSTPKSGPITMELKLAITLRILAGASYLDLIWYGVQVDSVHTIFLFTLKLLDQILPNSEIFNFDPAQDNFVEEIGKMASEWSSIMLRKKGFDCFKGTVLAGDGLVVPINAPTEKDRNGLDLSAFRNRKGCFAINVQAFCDGYCRFRYFEVSWPGSTNDITAYKQTNLYKWFVRKLIPECWHMVLDEAYGSIGGNQHLTPFTKHQLRNARETSEEKYEQMKAFNNFLSSQRITIERAFGLYIRKWGILWKPLEYDLVTNTLIVIVCAKLHNVSINHWFKHGYKADQIAESEANYKQQKDAGIFMGWGQEHLYDPFEEHYNNSLVAQLYGNHLPNDPTNRIVSQRKMEIMHGLYEKGFRYNVQSDNDFTYLTIN